MADKGDPKIQRERIERIAKEMEPNAVVTFDWDAMPSFLKWRVTHGPTGTVLLESSGDWMASELADNSDRQLKDLLTSLSAGRLR
jgi:phage gpG-like protein